MRLVLLFLTLFQWFVAPRAIAAKILWEVKSGLSNPAHVLYVRHEDAILVTSRGKPGKGGWISRINLLGAVVDSTWINGLQAPAGMDIYNGTVYVADGSNLVAIDFKNKKIIDNIKVTECLCLNDVSVSKSGEIFVTAPELRTVFKISGKKIETFAFLAARKPMSILADDRRLLVSASEGFPAKNNVLENRREGGLIALDPRTGVRKSDPLFELKGRYVGVERYLRDSFLTVDLENENLLTFYQGGSKVLLHLTPGEGPGGVAFVPEKKAIVLPYSITQRVVAYQLP